MDNRPLKVKALECACRDIRGAPNRDEANLRYKKWEVFHNDPDFKEAVKVKQSQLKK